MPGILDTPFSYSGPVGGSPPRPTTTGAYEDALTSTYGDYNNLQGKYGDILDQIRNNPANKLSFNPLSYAQSGDEASALSDLSGLAANGGYSAQDIQDLRARGISPIRSVYANAQRELARSKSLQGGYSPNFAAVSAKMARDQSQQIATQTSNVNAGIAENVAHNRLAAAPAFASAAGSEESKKQNIDAQNESNREGVEKGNAQLATSGVNQQLDALSGARSLYGTTPALASTFGSQALAAAGQNAGNMRTNIDNGVGVPGGAYPPGTRSPVFSSFRA